MCVIVQKERGVEVPSEEILEKCFIANPDGAGILVHRKDADTCEIHKGLMTFKNFMTTVKNLNIQKDDDAVFHFRITTSGGTNPENCHPFPISKDIKDLKATRINTSIAFVHNGIVGNGDAKEKISDTQILIRDVISRDNIKNHLENPEVQKIINEIADNHNRFVVIDCKKNIFQRFGTSWTKDACGCWFSNTNWKYKFNSFSSHYSSDWYGGSVKKYSDSDSKIPDFNTILCPMCENQVMNKLLDSSQIFVCPTCGLIYDDRTFSIYNKTKNEWNSIIDIDENEFCKLPAVI